MNTLAKMPCLGMMSVCRRRRDNDPFVGQVHEKEIGVMLIDVGLNLTSSQFDRDRNEVLQRAVSAGVERMILTGTSVGCRDALHRSRTPAPIELYGGDSPA